MEINNKWDAPPGSTTWDTGERQSVKGLHMRVAKDGGRSWLFYYRLKSGKQRRPKIGDARKISLGQARKLALEMAAKVIQGKDPQGEVEAERLVVASKKSAAEAALTVEDLYNAIFIGHWSGARFQKSGWTKRVDQMWNGSLKALFGSKPFNAVKPPMIRAWKVRSEGAPYMFNRKLEVLSTIYRFAEQDRVIPPGSNPCQGIEPFPEKKRDRYATPEELRAIWAELDREALKNPGAAAYLKLAFLTGSRPEALHKARLENFKVIVKDGKRYGLLLSDGKGTVKSGENEAIVFSPEAMAIVDNLPNTKDGRMFKGAYPRDMWRRVREKIGSPDLWLRDSRRTFGTQGISHGVGLSVLGELMNHSNTDMTRRYAKLMPFARMAAAEQIAGNISKIVGEIG